MRRPRLRRAGLRVCLGLILAGLLTTTAPPPMSAAGSNVRATTVAHTTATAYSGITSAGDRRQSVLIFAVPLLAIGGAELMTALIFSVATVVTVTTTQQAINYCKRHGCSVNLTKARTAVQRPDSNSNKARKDRNLYIGYEIFYGRKTYKYGISLASRGVVRPQEQLRACNFYFGVLGGCTYKIITRKVGYLNARWWEHGRITAYFIMHGHCPPGQLKSCK
ncbi:hypothetical protein OIE67_40580 [Nonomuraea fuscirosea]|uniref:hypothetical protein n=1 Tax=Nonomuraea fuscirosea TaxID=1291556 RepID=UPI002DD872FD|nr:hypothetical protein [Nonomuraea fuscirosea]WSA50309.1 hypothetical protein OIE67_40580 [Nonomuraea fuscirosea]